MPSTFYKDAARIDVTRNIYKINSNMNGNT